MIVWVSERIVPNFEITFLKSLLEGLLFVYVCIVYTIYTEASRS